MDEQTLDRLAAEYEEKQAEIKVLQDELKVIYNQMADAIPEGRGIFRLTGDHFVVEATRRKNVTYTDKPYLMQLVENNATLLSDMFSVKVTESGNKVQEYIEMNPDSEIAKELAAIRTVKAGKSAIKVLRKEK